MTVRKVSPDKLALAANQNEKEREFWMEQLAGNPAKSHFPFDYKKADAGESGKGEVTFRFPEPVFSGLMKLSKGSDYTLNAILAAGLAVLLHKYTGSSDIILGAPIYKQDLEGEFLNTILVLRNRFHETAPFKEILVLAGRTIVKATEHYNYPLELLPEKLGLAVSPGECPLFDVMILLSNIHDKRYIEHISPRVNVIFSFTGRDEYIEGVVRYNPLLYAGSTVDRIVSHLIRLFRAVLVNVDLPLSALDILSQEERKQLLEDFNDTASVYPRNKTIRRLFEEQAEKTPDSIAVIGQNARSCALTYSELNSIANGLARYLFTQGVGENSLVGIMVERSIEMIVSILGVLKAGCAYVPLNPKAPEARTGYIMAECNIKIVLTGRELFSLSSNDVSSNDVTKRTPADSLAYVIFTSGSTGTPKGVPITHANLSPLLHWGYRQLGIGLGDRTLQNLAYYFDWSVWEIFITLTSGARLYAVPDDILMNPEACTAFIEEHRITILHATPTQYQYLISGRKKDYKLKTLRYLFIGAEKLAYELVERSFASVTGDCRVFNMYGPTECTIISSVLEIDPIAYKEFKDLSGIPIGLPAANARLLILDNHLKLCPVNVAGELYIGGDGLAAGYLSDPEKSGNAFIKNIYEPEGIMGDRLYKTGDLARWLPDGNIEFLGRIDHQVKLRGLRIELGEIESQLLKHPAVKEAAVKIKTLAGENETGEKYICAYIVPHNLDDETFANASSMALELKKHLSPLLPDYMIPAYFMRIDKIPLNPNGKIDEKALPAPPVRGPEEYLAPANEVEESLAGIWSEVLGIGKERISVIADFFELGGHSLKATVLISKIHKTFNIKLPFIEVFARPTIKALAEYITGAAEESRSSIPASEKKEYYVLSSMQKRLYVLQEMTPESTVYNMPQTIPLGDVPDKERLEQTFLRLIARHESLRTSFHTVDSRPVQKVHENVKFKIEFQDFQKDRVDHPFVRAFDLSQAPLLRVRLIKVGKDAHLLMVDMHHIIGDGVSRGVLEKDFEAFSLGVGEGLPALGLHYKDFAQWQDSEKGREIVRQQEAYWQKVFEGEIPVLNLPVDYPRPVVQSFEGSTVRFDMGIGNTKALKGLALEEGATLYMLLLVMINILLSKLTGQEDIVIGTPIAGRRHAEFQQIIGMFVNTLAMRNFPEGWKKTGDFLAEVKERTLQAYENQDYPFEELVEYAAVNRDTGRNPLFDIMFALQNIGENLTGIPEADQKNQTGQPLYRHKKSTAKFDLTLIAVESGENLVFTIQYCSRLFKKETVEGFIAYFKRLAVSITKNPAAKLSGIEIISGEEKKRLLVHFNKRETRFPTDKTIPQLFAEQVEKTPDCVAVTGRSLCETDGAVSYKELNHRSGQLAHYLCSHGVIVNDLVGIMVERSLEMIVGILGILKAGCAYVPLNPKAPQARTDYILAECDIKILLTARELSSMPSLSSLSSNDAAKKTPAASLAYVIFTSGSTGNPKGVPITHANLSPLLHWGYRHLGISPADRTIQNLSYYFDWSVWEIFITLTTGASLYTVPDEILLDPETCIAFMNRHGITVLHVTPSQHQYIVGVGKKTATLRYLFIGAEKLTRDLVRRSYELVPGNCRVFNMYGPTECTIISAVLEIEPGDDETFENLSSVPIGGPVGNTALLVLDRNLKLCPVNVQGELYIAGDGVAAGYLCDPEKSGKAFIKNIYKTEGIGGPRLYKTGDLVRWLPDGNIEFFGRIDHQVKIRGYRIELGEIESRLLKHPEVKETVVLAREEEKYLCAYLVSAGASDKTTPVSTEFKEYLSQSLPDYMIPAYFIKIDKIPLTPNGKVDRSALPAPETVAPADLYAPPSDELERKLVEIWAEVLGVVKDKLSIDTGFFQLGGHSLKATTLVSEMHRALDVKVPLIEVFTLQTIRELARFIRASETRGFTGIEAAEKRDYYPLSPAQKRLYILQQMKLENTVYNMPEVVPLGKEADNRRLENTFKKLIHRHESLRTSFHMIGREPVQRVHDPGEIEFSPDYYEIAGDKVHFVIQAFIKPFDLSGAPLLRVGIIKLPDHRSLLMVDMHHIISDGVSHRVLREDFISLFTDRRMSPLPLQYKDYSQWLNKEEQKTSLRQQERYWLKEFAGEIPVVNLPTDFPRPVVQSFDGSAMTFGLEAGGFEALKKILSNEGITLYMLLLAVINILLSKLSGQEDIVIGTPVAGRRHADLQHIIGMFVNTLALRSFPQGNKTFQAFLQEIKERTLTAFENQDHPFEELVEKIDARRDAGRNPVFDIMFALQNQDPEKGNIKTETGDIREPFVYENRVSKFDLTLIAVEAGDALRFNFQYCVKLFKNETVKRFIDYFKQILSTVTEDPGKRISEIEIILEEERRQVLNAFNDTGPGYPGPKTILQLFTEQVEKKPEGIAVIGRSLCESDGAVSYRELNHRSGQLAHYLCSHGVIGNDLVGIMVERSIEMIVSILGILKAGCAYVPLNPKAPKSRTNYILDECNIKILLTGRELSSLSPNDMSLNDAAKKIPVTSLAYVIFTSGSTGTPKGVPITHANLSPLLHWGYRDLRIGPADRTIQNLSYYFDWSVWEIFITLTSGASLYSVPDEILLDPEICIDFMETHGITVLHVTPTQYGYFLNTGRKLGMLRFLFIGAEKLSFGLVQRSLESVDKTCRVFNMYGPTEATIIASALEIHRREVEKFKHLTSVPIGGPLGNTQFLVLDKYLKLCPVNIPGELYIAGEGLAAGYLSDPEKSGKSFVKNIRISAGIKGAYLYKTGDLVRWLPGGDIEFLGRKDYQVKIRGFRIEPGEIENRLLTHEKVKDAVVIDREAGGTAAKEREKYLCAYIVADSKEETPAAELKEYLSRSLPDYMIPSYIIRIDRIPFNPNGKVDRKALPVPETAAESVVPYEPPGNEIEKKLVEIWSDVLTGSEAQRDIGINDDFFELGGHSLKATLLTAKIREKFDIAVPLVEVFRSPTVKQLAEYIGNTRDEDTLLEDENLVLLKKNAGINSHLFFIHDGTGEVEGYVEFCNRLSAPFNCWGIRADRSGDKCPQNLLIQDIAAAYIKKIKKVQPQGPYLLTGWSIGGTIAFEIFRQLQQAGENTGFLALVDAVPPQKEPVNAPGFTLESELQWIRNLPLDNRFYQKLENSAGIKQLWAQVVHYLESNRFNPEILSKLIPKGMTRVIPNYRQLGVTDILYYLNVIRTLDNARNHYVPEGKLETFTHFFKAEQSKTIEEDRWSGYFREPVTFHTLSGDHFSIFKIPGVIDFAGTFDRILDEVSQGIEDRIEKKEKIR